MKNKIIIPGILFTVVAIFAVVVMSGERQYIPPVTETDETQVEDNGIILFYGDGCPHCEIVDEFVKNNDIENKVSFTKKEVYYDKQNADELVAKAKICGVPTNSIGVPFLWNGSLCLVGDQDIIEFFRLEANAQ